MLEQSSLTLLALAGTERPAGLDNVFLDRIAAEGTANSIYPHLPLLDLLHGLESRHQNFLRRCLDAT